MTLPSIRSGRTGRVGRTGRRRADRDRPDPGRRTVVGVVLSVVLVAGVLGFFPVRAWFAQRAETRDKREELAAIEAQGDEYQDDIDRLETPEEVERIAREKFGMVRDGEKAFQVAPQGVAAVDLPDTWPFAGVDDWLNR
ncbi:MAG: septum formation initiator family protein [Acidimicrobiales bacterium]|nr:septum formation initiator family protein [Acidimicrobiales bacterium]